MGILSFTCSAFTLAGDSREHLDIEGVSRALTKNKRELLVENCPVVSVARLLHELCLAAFGREKLVLIAIGHRVK